MALERKFTRRKKLFLTKIDNVHVNIIMLHVDINKSHVNIIMLHVDIIYLACRGQKYVTMQHNYVNMRLIYVKMQYNYVNMRLIYVQMQHNYVNMRLSYVYMQHNYVHMRLLSISCMLT